MTGPATNLRAILARLASDHTKRWVLVEVGGEKMEEVRLWYDVEQWPREQLQTLLGRIGTMEMEGGEAPR